jgi:hypothetical protein
MQHHQPFDEDDIGQRERGRAQQAGVEGWSHGFTMQSVLKNMIELARSRSALALQLS